MWAGHGYGGAPLNKQDIMDFHLGGKAYGHPHGVPFGMSLQAPFFTYYYSVLRTTRKRLNGLAILLNVLVPWLFFCLTFALCSFYFRYTEPVACLLLIAFLILCGTCSCCCVYKVAEIRKERDPDQEIAPGWYIFLCSTCILAVVSGALIGGHNFDVRMKTYYDYENLATYRDIDPASYVGQQLVDAGRIIFNDKTHLDVSKSMGFKDSSIYCVAPIVSTKTTKDTFIDFWAVGKGCCSGIAADFHCQGYNDASVRGGLRLMSEEERPFYRLAVQQAEAYWGIVARKPLFFTWHAEPIKYIDNLKYNAIMLYTSGVIAAFCAQCFLVISATLVFSKIYPSRSDTLEF